MKKLLMCAAFFTAMNTFALHNTHSDIFIKNDLAKDSVRVEFPGEISFILDAHNNEHVKIATKKKTILVNLGVKGIGYSYPIFNAEVCPFAIITVAENVYGEEFVRVDSSKC